ncbi:hypothetical protein E2C01_098564 [Portunus trituberculatus]|uniref:Uncharacterized protein n=1 Tax=Portunus trituberculatus TaxID=210409 RepID=A0A5B7KEH7_PORTR|nr:hypothetical protein [Portunus trituberculatus]
MERYSGDSDNFDPETMMTQLRHDLADAMMDTQHSSRGRDAGECAFTFVSLILSGSQILGRPLSKESLSSVELFCISALYFLNDYFIQNILYNLLIELLLFQNYLLDQF